MVKVAESACAFLCILPSSRETVQIKGKESDSLVTWPGTKLGIACFENKKHLVLRGRPRVHSILVTKLSLQQRIPSFHSSNSYISTPLKALVI